MTICRVCQKPIHFWQETYKEKNGEKYHIECFGEITDFIKWENK